MKIGEAIKDYRANRQELIDQTKALIKRRDELQKKAESDPGGKSKFAEDAAILELSIQGTQKAFQENQDILDKLMEQHCAEWNLEVAEQQGDAIQDYFEDLGKIMETARRIAKGDKVPAQDEKKVMEYSMELYEAAKNMAMMEEMQEKRKEREEHDSLWGEEEEEKVYDPQGRADNATVGFALPPKPKADIPTDGAAEGKAAAG